MKGISISLIELIIKGIPEGFLTILGMHFFTKTKVDGKKYFLLGIAYIVITYLVRKLPIHLGVNTLISILTMILLFWAAYKEQREKAAKIIASAVAIYIIIMVSEAINVLSLQAIYGRAQMELLLSDEFPLTKSIYTIPSTVLTAVFIFVGRALLSKYDKRKAGNGKAGK